MVSSDHFISIGNTLLTYLEEDYLCDTVLVTRDGQLKAHSILLAAVSPVFNATFKTNYKPGMHYINLPDVNCIDVEVALYYIYTGKLLLPPLYTRTNELPKLFTALHHLGLDPHQLNGCEMKFRRY